MIETPLNDKRTYHPVTLDNGLDCLLIHDDASEKVALGLSVQVGFAQDSIDGLAHLVEHMIFLGTHKFPTENELDAYLSASGGFSNAYTDLEETVFYADCQAPAWEGALERFASCFTGPLLLESSLEREIQAVDSEHAKNVQNDDWKLQQLSKTHLAKAPYSNFGSGNAQTLLTDDMTALRKAVVDFYNSHYRASNMKLSVLGPMPLEDLERVVRGVFADLPNGEASTPPTLPPLDLLPLPRRVDWVTTRDTPVLEVQWPIQLETRSRHYRLKPTHYLSHLLGHEGPGSLLALLRERHVAHDLVSGSKSTSSATVFTLQVTLTDIAHVDTCLELLYDYVDNVLVELPEWVYEELMETSQLQFAYLSQTNPADTVASIVSSMQHYPIEHVLSGPYKVYDSFDRELVQTCLRAFRPDNMLLLVGNKTHEGDLDQVDPHYGTPYRVLDWVAPGNPKTRDPLLHLPDRNDMIASLFDLVPPDKVFLEKRQPRCLINSDTCRLWYQPDVQFGMPKVNVLCLLRSPMSYSTPEQAVVASLWVEAVTELTNVFAYAASMAGLHCDFSNVRQGVEIHVSGYSHKAGVLLQRIMDSIGTLECSQELFDRLKDKLEQQYMSFMVAQPYQHAIYIVDLTVEATKWAIQDRIEILKETKLDDLLMLHQQVLQSFQLDMLVHGNMSTTHAKEMATIVLDAWKPRHPRFHHGVRVANLPRGVDHVYRARVWNPNDTNSSTVNLYMVGELDMRATAMLSLINHLVKEPAFSQLRTTEQLGYIVHTQVKTNGDHIKSLLILIQGDSYDAAYLDERIEAFVAGFRSTLVGLSADDYTKTVESLKQSLLEKNKNLGEESWKHWKAIKNESYEFFRLEKIAESLDHVTLLDLVCFYDRYLSPTSPYRRKLSVQMFGKDHTMTEALTPRQTRVDLDFVDRQQLFPRPLHGTVDQHLMPAEAP